MKLSFQPGLYVTSPPLFLLISLAYKASDLTIPYSSTPLERFASYDRSSLRHVLLKRHMIVQLIVNLHCRELIKFPRVYISCHLTLF